MTSESDQKEYRHTTLQQQALLCATSEVGLRPALHTAGESTIAAIGASSRPLRNSQVIVPAGLADRGNTSEHCFLRKRPDRQKFNPKTIPACRDYRDESAGGVRPAEEFWLNELTDQRFSHSPASHISPAVHRSRTPVCTNIRDGLTDPPAAAWPTTPSRFPGWFDLRVPETGHGVGASPSRTNRSRQRLCECVLPDGIGCKKKRENDCWAQHILPLWLTRSFGGRFLGVLPP